MAVPDKTEKLCYDFYRLLDGKTPGDCQTVIANCSAQLAIEYAKQNGCSPIEAGDMIIDAIREVLHARLS